MTGLNKIAKPTWILTLASIAVVIAGLYLAKGLLVPLTLAVLLSFLLSPVCDWLERRRLPRIPAVLVTASLGFTLLGIVVWTAAWKDRQDSGQGDTTKGVNAFSLAIT